MTAEPDSAARHARRADVGVTGRPAVFLDRDGVLNEAFVGARGPTPPRSLDEFRLLPGVAAACAQLHRAGYVLVVITNQPDIARGSRTRAEVDRLNARLRELVPELDEVIVCPHDDEDRCRCRKPEPGMILDAAARLGLDLSRSVCVGDRTRDIEAARRACVHSILVTWQSGEADPDRPDVVVSSLAEAVSHIHSHMGGDTPGALAPSTTGQTPRRTGERLV